MVCQYFRFPFSGNPKIFRKQCSTRSPLFPGLLLPLPWNLVPPAAAEWNLSSAVTKLLNTAGNNTIKFPINAIMTHTVHGLCRVHCKLISQCTVRVQCPVHCSHSALYSDITVHRAEHTECTLHGVYTDCGHCRDSAWGDVTFKLKPSLA